MSRRIEANPFAFSRRFAGMRLHLGVTGSIACYRATDLLRALLKLGLNVSATLTEGAKHFVTPLLFRSLGADPVWGEMFEDEKDVFAHLAPGKEAAALAVVPASADFLARIAQGCAKDMLAAQVLAFDGPLVLAPAMNPRMWNAPATRENVEKLRARGTRVIAPGFGAVACGDEGAGRLADLPEIFLEILKALSPQDMGGLHALVTLGPTREYWDDARFWSNASSGKMGCALATAAWLRGARVSAVCGPCADIFMPPGIKMIRVNSGREMFKAAESVWPQCDLGIFCAAVSDFHPQKSEIGGKVGRADVGGEFKIPFGVNPDIIATLAAKKGSGQKVLGFAAEIAPDMDALLPRARKKLAAKNADVLAANRIDGGAFGGDMNSVLALDRKGRHEIWPDESKADIAWNLLTWLLNV